MKIRLITCRRQAMTLVEIIVAMAILATLLYSLSMFVHKSQIIWRQTTSRTRLYESARLVLDVLSRDLQGMVVNRQQGYQLNYTCTGFGSSPDYVAGTPTKMTDFDADQRSLVMAFHTNNDLGINRTTDFGPSEIGYEWYGNYNMSLSSDEAKANRYTLYRKMTAYSDGAVYNGVNATPATWADRASWADDVSGAAVNRFAKLADGVYSVRIVPYYRQPVSGVIAPATVSDSTTLPHFIHLELTMFDPALLSNADLASNPAQLGLRTDSFVKRIYLRQGNAP
jgi:prepilin-type N-terminal cleavage/methylation domain-containing protein